MTPAVVSLKKVLQSTTRSPWRKKLSAKNSDIEEAMVLVTPEMAEQLLENHNPRNRKVIDRKVSDYRHLLRSGLWNPDQPDSTLAFGKDGFTKNGQHRLLACKLERVPFLTRIEIGHDNDILLHLDQHGPRSEKAQAFILDRPRSEQSLYPAVKMLYQIDNELTYFPLAKFEVYNLIDHHYNPEIFQIVPDSLVREKHLLYPIKAALLFLAQHWPNEVREFVRQIKEMDFKDGPNGGPGRLYQYMTVSKDYLREKTSYEGRWIQVSRTFKCFHLFLEGATRDNLHKGTDSVIAIRRMLDADYIPKEKGPFAKRRNKKRAKDDVEA